MSTARRGRDLAALAGSAVLLLLAAVPVHQHSVGRVETDAFRAVNGAPDLPFALVWPVMQLGNLLVLPVVAVVVLAARRWRLAAQVAAGGALAYLGAKVVKGIVVRGRPGALLSDVTLRHTTSGGLGFVSGHAAVVGLLTVVLWPWLPRRWRPVLPVLAVAVCLARLDVGAHLPLDVVGGLALGAASGYAVRWLIGGSPRAWVERPEVAGEGGTDLPEPEHGRLAR